MDAVNQEVFESIRRELQDRPIMAKRFLDAWREETGWTGSYAQARRRLCQWLDPDDPHQFPLAAMPVLIRVLGHARFLDALLALEVKAAREQRIGPQRAERRGGRGERGAA